MIYSFSWLDKNVTTNPNNDDNKYFQYTATVALNHEEIEKNWKEYQKLKLLWLDITGKE